MDTTVYVNIKEQITNISEQYKLFQNYPNPFNSVSNIKYQITNNKFITLKIFNILGKEISVLVNKKQSKGTYEVKFDGSNISSGIYFCSLIVTDKQGNVYRDTKKVLMIK